MANTLTNLIPKILARALINLRERCVMPRLVNSDYGTDPAQKGTTIDVPVPVAVGTTNVSPSNTLASPTDLTPGNVQISLNNWKQNNPIALTDKELTQIDANQNFLPMQLTEAIRALASDVNQSIWGYYKGSSRGIYGVAGQLSDGFGVTPFDSTYQGVAGATLARKVLNKQLCPRSNRRGVVDFDAEANMLALAQFSDAEKIMGSAVKIEGEIGRKYGIDWVADDDVPTHTAGTAKTLTGTLTASDHAIGTKTITTVTSNNSGDDGKTIEPGDIIKFSGDSQTYVVCGSSTYTLTGSSGSQEISDLVIYPGLKVATSSSTITVYGSHVVNIAFHRDSIAFANRPLANPLIDGLGSKIMSMQDPVTGLVMRLEVSRQHKQQIWEFDLLWGADLVRPEMATRIIGQAS